MTRIFHVRLNFSSASSINNLLLSSLLLWFYLIFNDKSNSVLYITRLMILYFESKKLRRLSITKNIKPKQGFIKPTALVTFIIFTPLSLTTLGTIHFEPSNSALLIRIIVINMLLSLQIKHIFLKIYRFLRDFRGWRYFILFWYIHNNIAFSRATSLKRVVLYKKTEGTIYLQQFATEVKKLVNVYN